MGCRTARPAEELYRVVRLPNGALTISQGSAGRGAWLCRKWPDCLTAAERRHAFDKAFGASVGSAAIAGLREWLAGASEQAVPDVRD